MAGKASVDAKVVYSTAGFCSVLGLVLLIVGALVYTTNANDGEYACTCPGGDAECCKELHSVCDECWCEADSAAGGEWECKDYDHTGTHGGAGLGLAIAGLIVSLLSAAMLITMRRCKNWSEKNLHVTYPAVTPGVDTAA